MFESSSTRVAIMITTLSDGTRQVSNMLSESEAMWTKDLLWSSPALWPVGLKLVDVDIVSAFCKVSPCRECGPRHNYVSGRHVTGAYAASYCTGCGAGCRQECTCGEW